MKRTIPIYAAVAFLAASLLVAIPAQAQVNQGVFPPLPQNVPAPRALATLKSLLDEGKIPYTTRQTQDGEVRYYIRIESENGNSEIVAREIAMRWKRKDGSPVRAIYLYVPVVKFPATFAPSAALLKLLADKNNDLAFGNLGIGKFGVFYSNSMWLYNADLETFADVLAIAHNVACGFRKECQPYVKQE